MNRPLRFASFAASMAAAAATVSIAAAPQGPSRPANRNLASVNGDVITLVQLKSDLEGASDPDPWRALERRINLTLAVQEANRMGLADTLEVRDQLGVFERDTLRDGLFATRVGSLKPDPKAVAELEKAMATQVRMRSILLPKEADAKAFADAVAKGKEFEAAMKEFAAAGRGQLDEGEGFIKMSELRPEVQQAIAPLAPGQVSPVYKIETQFAVTRLADRKVVQDPGLHGEAEAETLRRAQLVKITAYVEELKAKYAKVDTAMLAAVDFDAKEPGFDALLKDNRALATIAGEPPVTVGEVAGALRKRLFHGTEQAGGRGKLNRRKAEILDDLVAKRVVMKEARRLGLDKKPEYVALRNEKEKELLFGAFVGKVLASDVNVTDAEVSAYYKAHLKEFTEPDMIRLDSLPFDSRATAEAALAKLRAGADLTWMRSNAPGRLDADKLPEDQRIPAVPVIVAEMPQPLREAVAGARTGEFRLYVPTVGAPSVVLVRDLIKGKAQSLDSASAGIRGKLTGEKRQKAFDDYVAKLRAASDVKVFVTSAELKTLIGGAKSAS